MIMDVRGYLLTIKLTRPYHKMGVITLYKSQVLKSVPETDHMIIESKNKANCQINCITFKLKPECRAFDQLLVGILVLRSFT